MLDILDSYKVNSKLIEHLRQTTANQHETDLNIFEARVESKGRSMTSEKGVFVQQRREYYNDFEDCLRDYKNAKIKSLQKQTKVHLSDGDNGESDSDYVDCSDTNDLKASSLSSKSMPHVPTENYQDKFCQQLELKPTTIRNEIQAQTTSSSKKAQLNTNYNVLRIKHETSAQLTSHNNDHNQIIDSSCKKPLVVAVKSDCKVSSTCEKSIPDNVPIQSTSDSKQNVNQTAVDVDKQQSKVIHVTPQATAKRDESTKRRSCKKKSENVSAQDPTQR